MMPIDWDYADISDILTPLTHPQRLWGALNFRRPKAEGAQL